jgi:hypothetical protein
MLVIERIRSVLEDLNEDLVWELLPFWNDAACYGYCRFRYRFWSVTFQGFALRRREVVVRFDSSTLPLRRSGRRSSRFGGSASFFNTLIFIIILTVDFAITVGLRVGNSSLRSGSSWCMQCAARSTRGWSHGIDLLALGK